MFSCRVAIFFGPAAFLASSCASLGGYPTTPSPYTGYSQNSVYSYNSVHRRGNSQIHPVGQRFAGLLVLKRVLYSPTSQDRQHYSTLKVQTSAQTQGVYHIPTASCIHRLHALWGSAQSLSAVVWVPRERESW